MGGRAHFWQRRSICRVVVVGVVVARECDIQAATMRAAPGAGGTLGEPGRCCTKVTFMVSYIPSLPP